MGLALEMKPNYEDFSCQFRCTCPPCFWPLLLLSCLAVLLPLSNSGVNPIDASVLLHLIRWRCGAGAAAQCCACSPGARQLVLLRTGQ